MRSVSGLLFGAFTLSLPTTAQDLVGVTQAGGIYAIESATGAATLISPGPFGMQSLARSDDGSLWTVGRTLLGTPQYFLMRIDPDSFDVQIVAPSVDTRALADAGGGELFAIEYVAGNNFLSRVDVDTGVRTFVGATGQNIQGLAVVDDTLYAWSVSSGLGTLNPTTGAFTDLGPAPGSDAIEWLGRRADGALIGGAYDFYTLDTATGVATGYATGSVFFQGVEPTGMVLPYGDGCYGVTLKGSGSLRPGSVLTTLSTGYPVTGAIVGVGGALLLGTSRTVHLGTPLPLDLDPFLGTDGCSLLTSVEITRIDYTTGVTPSLFFPVAIPPGYHDGTFYVQHAGFDFLGRFFWSNAIQVHIGS